MLDRWHNLSTYQAALSESLYPSRLIAAEARNRFRARTATQTLGPLSLVKAHANAPFTLEPMTRTRREDCYVLHLQLNGRTAYSHRDGEIPCSPNTLLLTNSRDVIMAEQRSAADAMVVKIPGQMLRDRFEEAEQFCWLPTQSNAGAAHILRTFLLDLWRWGAQIEARSRNSMLNSLFCMMESVFVHGNEAGAEFPALHDPCLPVRREIARRLHDPDLRVADIARAVGMSRSKLYRVTAQAGTTVERLVIDTRLDHVIAKFHAREDDRTNLTELALDAGFFDPSHFSRCFRRKFGTTPSAYREALRRRTC